MRPRITELFEQYRYFQMKFREYQELFKAQRQRYFLIECAWCQRRICWKPKTAAVPGQTSHGICPACATDLCRKRQAMKASQAGSSNLTQQSVA